MKKIYDSVIGGEVEQVIHEVQIALAAGTSPVAIIEEGLIAAMAEVSDRMKSGNMYVPEVLIAAEAMKQGLLIVKPLLLEGEEYSIGKVIIGTVKGDLHDIGKNLVAMLLESAGFEVIDLGVDAGKDEFLTAAADHQPDIVGLSALLTTTMSSMRETVKALNEKFPAIKTMIGGAPISQEFADEIGASGYAPDGATAVDLAKKLRN
jgi:5-methyltetrahydrofolate--homocysteine methyltransferase